MLHSGSRSDSALASITSVGSGPKTQEDKSGTALSLQPILESGMGMFQVSYSSLPFWKKADSTVREED